MWIVAIGTERTSAQVATPKAGPTEHHIPAKLKISQGKSPPRKGLANAI